MLPIDEDILQSRYGNDPLAARWYELWRKAGAQPNEAIRAADEMRSLTDGLPMVLPDTGQQQALQRYVDTCAGAIEVFCGLEAYQSPTDQQITSQHFAHADAGPITPEKIQELVAEAQRVTVLVVERLTHSHRSSTDT